MERTEKALNLPCEQFKRNIGTTKPVFQQMMTVLQVAYETLHQSGGKPPDLTVGDKLLITLQEYRTIDLFHNPEFTSKTFPFYQNWHFW